MCRKVSSVWAYRVQGLVSGCQVRLTKAIRVDTNDDSVAEATKYYDNIFNKSPFPMWDKGMGQKINKFPPWPNVLSYQIQIVSCKQIIKQSLQRFQICNMGHQLYMCRILTKSKQSSNLALVTTLVSIFAGFSVV